MDKGVDFNFERYVGNLKKKLTSLESDLEAILKQRDTQKTQLEEFELRKAELAGENERLAASLQQAKAKKLELTLKSQQNNKEFKLKNMEYIKLVDEANEKAQGLQGSINQAEEEYKSLQAEKQKVLHSNNELLKKKEQVLMTCTIKQQALDKKMKETNDVEAIDNKRREVLLKTLTELQL